MNTTSLLCIYIKYINPKKRHIPHLFQLRENYFKVISHPITENAQICIGNLTENELIPSALNTYHNQVQSHSHCESRTPGWSLRRLAQTLSRCAMKCQVHNRSPYQKHDPTKST